MTRTFVSRFVPGFVFSACLLVAGSARATDNFPPAMARHLGLSYTPECAVCHLEGRTGGGSVVTPFGRSARERGLVEEDEKILNAVLDRMAGERVDSDADGLPDVEELVAGSDPNLPPGGGPGPQTFGCFARIAAGERFSEPFAPLLAAVIGGILWRRAGRRRSFQR